MLLTKSLRDWCLTGVFHFAVVHRPGLARDERANLAMPLPLYVRRPMMSPAGNVEENVNSPKYDGNH